MVGKLAAAALISGAVIIQPAPSLAQSVLERVLGQIDGATNLAPVNGTYANIAESIGLAETTTTTGGPYTLYTVAIPVDPGGSEPGYEVPFLTVTYDMLGTSGTVAVPDIGTFQYSIGTDGSISVSSVDGSAADFDTFLPGTTIEYANNDDGFTITSGGTDGFPYDFTGSSFFTDGAGGYYYMAAGDAATLGYVSTSGPTTVIVPGIATVIDGSITNLITGVTAATAEAIAGAATATEFVMPTVDLGNIATTALGAVNTGEITLGVNSAVDEAKTTTTNAISAAMTQIGGSADAGAIVLNVASNASAVNGSIQNTMTAVNGSVGNINTTALGAVNTGTIVSGVDAAVQGIVGMSGQASSGL